ncbi:GNAT family N-acetyltransferase [Microbacterium sp. M3]|uniref:GNAT family N-acetyltransferase n=1 Tax=Microbacterium arthrosphaerae TaxID=792652 RepID=A0ABU4H1G4_9MICO|nr:MULTISPECIES: GNAT family N-acetyltransferase [Microbacterium]MDW4572519.1 GNAT family N-acetyltransferase [Microbacterium arthrosphaerae]MDW7606374.1 GNAT family N-acetyltransferase [Microbacterium sp. M3]
MTAAATVRRIRADEWPRVRDLRIEAVSDPDAAIAFLYTPEEELAHDDGFWRARAARAAAGGEAAQFVAEVDGEWVGTATVLVRPAGIADHTGRTVYVSRADVVGVYVRPSARGRGVIDGLLDAAAEWTAAQGLARLTLDVHADNARAQAAYRRNGFAPTGVRFTARIGPELEMARVL